MTLSHSGCADFTVELGQATQLQVSDNDDLAIYIAGRGSSRNQDGFQFGRETLTIIEPGAYRAELRIVKSGRLRLNAILTRRTLPSEAASLWQSVEQGAAKAKLSRDKNDIVASLQQWESLGDASGVARTTLELGDAQLHAGEAEAAEQTYLASLEQCQRLADTRCVAEAANNAGLTERRLGNLDRSRDLFLEATTAWKRLGLFEDEGVTYLNLGLLYWTVADYRQAIAFYDQARARLVRRNPLAYARVLNNLGLTYLSLADYPKAQLYFARAIESETGLKNAKEDQLRARLNLGRTLMLQGRLLSAEETIEKTLRQSEALPSPSLRGYALNNLGQVLWRQKQYGAARKRLQEALEVHISGGDRRWQANAYYWLGKTAARCDEPENAREMLRHSLEIRHAIGLRDDEADSLEALGQLEWESGNPQQAQNYTEEALQVLESVRNRVPGPTLRASFLTRRRVLFDLRVKIAMRSDNPHALVDGFLAAERGRARALMDLIVQRPGSSAAPSELLARRKIVLSQLDLLSARSSARGEQIADLERRVEQLLAEDEEIEAGIQEAVAREEPAVRATASFEKLQNVIPADSALLEFYIADSASYLWLVTPEHIQLFQLAPAAAIEKRTEIAATLFPDVVGRLADAAKQTAFNNSMAWLSRELLGKLKGVSLPRRLILVPDGSLHRLPFAALKLSSDGYLGIEHDLIQIPSAGFLRYGAAVMPVPQSTIAVLAFADPVFSGTDPRIPAALQTPTAQGGDLARLPFSDELDTLARLVPPSRLRILRGFDASRKALIALYARTPAILHLSTHALIDDQAPEFSQIVFSRFGKRGDRIEGNVLPHEVANLHLRGSIVVVSACRTALGKQVYGEGLMGFADSFFSAGAAQLVLTLSDVDAQASSIFLSAVYQQYFGPHGEEMEHAMTLARRNLLSSRQWADPFYWASFEIIGMPSHRASSDQS